MLAITIRSPAFSCAPISVICLDDCHHDSLVRWFAPQKLLDERLAQLVAERNEAEQQRAALSALHLKATPPLTHKSYPPSPLLHIQRSAFCSSPIPPLSTPLQSPPPQRTLAYNKHLSPYAPPAAQPSLFLPSGLPPTHFPQQACYSPSPPLSPSPPPPRLPTTPEF